MNGHAGEALSALLDGELSGLEAASVRAHLAECAPCRTELAAVEQARSAVRALPMLDPPARRPRPSRAAGVAAAAVAAAASLLFVAAASSPQSPGAPKVADLVDVHATSGGNADPVTQLTPVAFNQE